MIEPIYQGLLQSDLNASGYKMVGLATPTVSTDAANKAYVDAHGGGGGGGGSSYTVVDTTVSGDATRIIVPTPRVSGATVIYCHGLGESDPTAYFDPITSDKHLYMTDALTAGYLMAAGNFGGFGWSNATAQAKIEAMVAYLVTNYGVTDIVLWSQSAGGPLGLLKATQGFSGVVVQGWFGIYPCVDLDVAHGNAALTASINSAFPSYPTDAAGRDPKLFSASAYNGLRLRCCQSAADTVLPKASHGDALVTLATGYAVEVTCVATSGDHGDASNFTQARVDDFVAFLNRCFSSYGPGPVYVGSDARLVALSGGVKLEVRNTSTNTWVEATRYTNP